MSSVSNNPGNGNLNGLKAKLIKQGSPDASANEVETIIEERYEAEPDDYNYVPEIREVDEEELRNLSAIRQETEVDKRVYMACAAFFVAALIGGAIGYAAGSISAGNADVHRKASVARTIDNTMKAKFTDFEKFEKIFKSNSGKFSEADFDSNISTYSRYNFMLDISSEVSSEAVLLLGRNDANPLENLRLYSARTMLLTQLLSIHVNETHADREAILELQNKGDSAKVTLAMQVLPEAILYLGTDAPRNQYANGTTGIFTYRDYISDDDKLSEAFLEMKGNARTAYQQQKLEYRTFQTGKKNEENPGNIPGRLIYNVLDRRGSNIHLFADELILVDRSLFFGESANALERYNRRNAQINDLLKKIEETRGPITSSLQAFIKDDE